MSISTRCVPTIWGAMATPRPTSPHIDAIAASGIRFDQVYVSDAPCLPSRSALFSGRFGVQTGVVNHGGRRADPFPASSVRGRQAGWTHDSWPHLLRRAGLWCATVSTFAERHSAFQWYAGFNEVINLGTDGAETADIVARRGLDWLRRKGRDDDWFLHLHFWDPHTPYRTPAAYGNPLAGTPPPTWIDDDVRARHWDLAGPHSAQEVIGFVPDPHADRYPRQPQQIRAERDVTAMFDGYDVGIRYADEHVGRLMSCLDELGIAEETAVMISSDHGEALGELGIYCDHQTADLPTHRVPAILRWPGAGRAVVDRALRYQVDLAATVAELVGVAPPPSWDGQSFAAPSGALGTGRDHLVLSCAAWSIQRAVRFGPWLCIRTYHDAFHGFPDVMLFDVESDPHEQRDLAADRPDVVGQAASLLVDWETAAMRASTSGTDPFWTVLAEGGGWYTRNRLGDYLDRLRSTGRRHRADETVIRHGDR